MSPRTPRLFIFEFTQTKIMKKIETIEVLLNLEEKLNLVRYIAFKRITFFPLHTNFTLRALCVGVEGTFNYLST